MTDSRSRPARRALFAPCLALCLAVAAMATQAADDPTNPNTFSTPSYPPSQQRNAMPTGQPGQANPPGMSNSPPLRGTQIQGGYATDPRATQNANQPEFTLRRTDQPPPKPGEFQKFVETATGRLLPLFGSRFFADAADAYAPVDNVPVSADYTVGPGDEIILRAWGAIDIDYRSTVDRNGLLNLPKVGSFNVSGVKASELEKHLRT
ncbi:MAG TPA: polysaccharide biosynthesis/export family protein, partial [Burkholderiaceae bacterium]|nr:polysaccharide biosynthesis/export family protein [Burkholderiaceae bacterium]